MSQTIAQPIRQNPWIVSGVWLARIAVGVTFLVSGFAKGVDPAGTVYKLTEYSTAFGLESYLFAPYFWALLLAGIEFLLGVNTLFGSYRRRTAWMDLLLMAVFTPLTLYIALKNPVSDCGCFGDLIHLNAWQTFFKNLVLLAFSGVLVRYNKQVASLYNDTVQWITILFALLYIGVIGWWGANFEPLLDFRPYRAGANIVASRLTENSYETKLVYEKEGIQKTFTLENYPANDTTWRFVEAMHQPLGVATASAFSDFYLVDAAGKDVTDGILSDPSYTFLMISPDLSKASESEIDKINELCDYSKERGYAFYGVTASGEEALKEWQESTGAEYSFLFADGTLLKTIARSNPAILLLQNGMLVWKKNPYFLPEEEVFSEPLEELSLGSIEPYRIENRFAFFALLFFVPMLLLLLTEKAVALVVQQIKSRRVKQMIARLAPREEATDKTALDTTTINQSDKKEEI